MDPAALTEGVAAHGMGAYKDGADFAEPLGGDRVAQQVMVRPCIDQVMRRCSALRQNVEMPPVRVDRPLGVARGAGRPRRDDDEWWAVTLASFPTRHGPLFLRVGSR